MVIDAGSTHSTVYTYKLNVPITGAVQELSNHSEYRMESPIFFYLPLPPLPSPLSSFPPPLLVGGPSLSNLTSSKENNLTEVQITVSNLIDAGSKELSGHEDLFNTTNVYIGATAGMRLLK